MRRGSFITIVLLAAALLATCAAPVHAGSEGGVPDPGVAAMIAETSEDRIDQTIWDLQNLTSRSFPSAGNRAAAEYISQRLDAIPALEVDYQSDRYHNIIATLPGRSSSPDRVIIVGAHYDSRSDDPERAPGATDNGGGVAIVLELAHVMSQREFDDTILFAFWNAEERKVRGSADFTAMAADHDLDIPLYLNYDSACYDPDNRLVLDVIYNEKAKPFAELAVYYNHLYDVGFSMTYNELEGISDHVPFWQEGYPAVMTAAESIPAEVHTEDDTIALVSTGYAKKNAQLGMALLSGVANRGVPKPGLSTPELPPGATIPDGMKESIDDIDGDGAISFAERMHYLNQNAFVAADWPLGEFYH